jgi:predicted nucleic-acid-binding protein
MIAVDTNVLVRYLTNDDPEQARRAMAVLAEADAILVPHPVLLGLEWVLRAVYDLPAESIHKSILQVLGLANVQVEKAQQVSLALSWYERGMDFADALHLALATGADRLVTFDQRFIKTATAQGLPVAPV